ncbi:hypothetical protein CRM22_009684 [Opisthorchis felineus]|uniref:Protein kinase domain-containing protein n=1 Tax=Opisthorchis felineus TaxID=147828 RepID=A0A4S2LD73_OPIFE|nr:hypothetical protein CRM22_009684 [Opisthorchis felineus]
MSFYTLASPPPTVTPDMAEPSEPSTDPHKRGRKFLYRLAPLLKLTLPSRVERRRTQSVFNLQAEAAPTGKSGNYLHQNNQTLSPRSGGIRTTVCEKQWIRHGTLIHHCISFMGDKSLTGMGGSFASGTQRCTIGLALRNADLYVQRLWHELQLRVHGNHFEKELGHRVFLAKKVIAQLVSFDLSRTDDARQAEQNIYSKSSSVPPASYVERIRIAHLAVSNILEKADRVEQAWSSEARMTADIVDWILPEVWSRLTCLRQWSGRLLIIQRGLSQLCAFLHNCSSGTVSCCTHSRQQRGSNLHGTEEFSEEIIRCPLLAAGANEAWKRLCRQFLLDSWYMCALPNHEQSPAQRGVSSELTSTPGGYSVALIRLNRLVDRLLTEIRGNRLGGRSPLPEPVPSRGKATQTCSPLHRNEPTMKNVSSTLFQRIGQPCLPARPLCVKCSSENVISSANSDRPLLREPHPSGVSVGSSSTQSSQYAASPNRRIIQTQNNESTATESSTLTWWHTLRKKLQQRSPASYASVVKRRSWNGCISPLELNIPHSDSVQTPHIGGLPVKWEICSPSHSVSPHRRSASSTPSPPSSPHRSDSNQSSVSTTSKSVSDNSSSSSSSLNSFPQTGCALAESPTSTTSEGTSYWSVDLPDIHPLEKSLSASASPVSPVQQDVGLELGLPPLVFLWLYLARIPFYVTRESVAMKLEQYADRVNGCTAPNRLSLIHLVHELRSLVVTALRVTRAYRRRLVVALKLNTVAQIPPVPLLSTRHVPSWPPTETQSDDSDGESGVYPSSHHRVPVSKPVWFLEATEQVRQFLDDATSPNSLVKLLEAYSDCLVRLLDVECSTLKGSPSDLRGLVEREWDHIRRVYRQIHRCRGGIHYASLSGLGIIDQHRQTVELTFVRLCKNVIGFLSERFAPQLGVWARGAATDPFKYAGCPKDIPIWEEAPQSSGPPATNFDSTTSFHTEATGWLSTKSSPWIYTSGVRNELFQEFNESWREIRAWLNCLLDLTTVVCNDLDTAVMMSLTIPASRPKTVGRNVPADTGQTATTTTVPDVAIKCRSSSSKSLGKIIRELRQIGHVLLYSWDKSGSCQPSSSSSSSGWDFGCVFIWSPFLRHASASSTPHVSENHTWSRDNSLVIASSETRRAVRKHISMFVHRMAKQLIFKPRKPPPACFLPMPELSGSDVRPGNPHGLINRIPAKNGFGGSVEYLLVCPGLPVKLWNGLAYNFMDVRGVPAYQSRSNHVRRSWYALQWLVALCCHSAFSSTPSMHQDHNVPGLPISLTTWLISDYPHAAWSLLRDSSDRLRRWLAFSCLNLSVLGGFKAGDGHLSIDQNSPGTRACSFQMAPIMADLYNSVHSLRRNLCDLSARLQGSLLVMESHLRSYLDNIESAPRPFSEASALGSRPSPTRFGSVSDGGDAVTLYALGVDPVQRAFSVVFGFHKTLIRLMSTAPVRAPFYSEERDPSGERVSLHTRLVHLGVRLLRSWADYVTSRYPRGRGRIPRWANDACHFAYRLCQPRSVKFLDAQKVSSLEATLNALIPHLVGERAAGESPTPVLHPHLVDHGPFSRCHSAAVPGRIHSLPCPTVLRPRRVHSLHGFLPSQKLSFNHQQSYKCAKSPCKAMGVSISEETPCSSDIRRRKTLTLLAELEARRDSQLRSLCLIGRTRLEQHRTPTKSIIPSQTAVFHPGACGGNTPKKVEYFPTHLGRRHFPYTWNRGRLIGMGATGKVFQAFNLQTQEMMAVKEIQLDQDFDDQSPVACPETLERLNSFRRECDLLSNLSHPALVRFLGADEQTPRVLRLFTELCSAGTLADVVKDSPSESLIRCYASDLASAIVYLHERGIVHRDIKPSNVFLVAYPTPIESARPNAIQNGGTGPQDQSRRFLHMPLLKLGDFSHSLRLHSFSSNAHGIAGTVCYMAPEVCRSSTSGYGKPCDIWSYCCVLLELITGRRPWYHVPEMHGVFYKLCCDETPLLPKVKPEPSEADGSISLTPSVSVYTSAEAFTLLRAGLTPDPSKRPTAPELFQFCFVQSPLSERR